MTQGVSERARLFSFRAANPVRGGLCIVLAATPHDLFFSGAAQMGMDVPTSPTPLSFLDAFAAPLKNKISFGAVVAIHRPPLTGFRVAMCAAGPSNWSSAVSPVTQ